MINRESSIFPYRFITFIEGPKPLEFINRKGSLGNTSEIRSPTDTFIRGGGEAIIRVGSGDLKNLLQTTFSLYDDMIPKVVVGIFGRKPFFTYLPQSRQLILPDGEIILSNIVDGFEKGVDGKKYWVSNGEGGWERFGNDLIRVVCPSNSFPIFELVIGDLSEMKIKVIKPDILNELMNRYGFTRVEELIRFSREQGNKRLRTLIESAILFEERKSTPLIISVILPDERFFWGIIMDDILKARRLALSFAPQLRLSTSQEGNEIYGLKS